MIAQLDAYVGRFGERFRAALAESLRADVQNPAHVQETLEQLRRGPDDDWFWVAALEEVNGAMVVHGFALCIVRHTEIFLAEIHTHPQSQRRGLARAMLREVLTFVANGPRGMTVIGLSVTLNVTRCRLQDHTEHPFAWYQSVSFQASHVIDAFPVGGGSLPMVHMRSTIGEVLSHLPIDTPRTVD